MRPYSDAELDRLADRADADDRARDEAQADDPTSGGAVAFVGKTVSDGSYPGSPGVCFKVQVVEITGTEAEGGSATKTPVDGAFVYAYHLPIGTSAPPVGTEVLCVFVPDRFVFVY